jgi:hypothetical protein
MDHRITTAIVVCVGGTLAFTLMLALFSSSVPPGADAAPGAPAHAAASAPRDRLAVVLRQLDSAAYRFRRQHGGADPDFAAHPDWDQFLQPTDARGRVLKAPGNDAVGPPPRTFGPYLGAAPVNPLNGRSNVVVTTEAVDSGDRVPSGPAGFVYSTPLGQFRATGETGKTVAAVVAPP